MSDIAKVLESEDKIDDAAKEFAEDIVSQRLDITEYVERLGPSLTSTIVEDRVKATRLLSTTLKDLPSDHLNETQLNFITTFYCDRLKDHHSVVPHTLTGMVAIVHMLHVPEGAAGRILHAMFHNVPCQSQVRADREKIFDIVQTLADNKQTELLAMGSDFVYGVINTMDGERDPRILLTLYEFLPTFLATFPLGHLADDMFEVIACYFPIDFNPSAVDPKAITRDLLATKLADCLCAREEFAENCVNLLVEKLDSQLNVAKLDSLYLLANCGSKFSASSIDQHFPEIWKALRAELLPGGSHEITIAALSTLAALLRGIASDETATRNVFTIILDAIVVSLADVDNRLFMPAAAIAIKSAGAGKLAATLIAAQCLPPLLAQLRNITAERLVQHTTLIEITSELLYAACVCSAQKDLDAQLVDDIQAQFIVAIDQPAKGNEKLINAGLAALAACAETVGDAHRHSVYATINRLLVTPPRVPNTNEPTTVTDITVIPALTAFATAHQDEVLAQIVTPLLQRNYCTQELTLGVTSDIFEAMCALVPIRKFRDAILTFIFKVIFDGTDGAADANGARLDIRLIGLRALLHLLDGDNNEQLADELNRQYTVFDRILVLVHSSALTTAAATPAIEHTIDDVLYAISQILRLVVRALDVHTQRDIISKYLPTVNLQLKGDLYFTNGLLGYLEQTVDLEDHFEHLIDELTKLSLHTDDEDLAKMSNQLMCSLFNKCPDNDRHRSVLRKAIDLIKHEIQAHNKKAVEVLSWISKGLLVRGHSDAAELIDTLIELLEHPTLSHAAVAAFEIISIEFPQLHLPIIKHLFKQKLFQIVLKKVWHRIETVSEKHLAAVVYVLKLAPHQVLCNNMDKVGPILLKCLGLTDAKPLLVALEICRRFLLAQDDFFRDHLQNVVPQCITLTTFEASLKVRIAAIECLSAASKYPTFIVLQFAQDVQIGLNTALDDKKRLVRNAAVQARNEWFVIGAPK